MNKSELRRRIINCFMDVKKPVGIAYIISDTGGTKVEVFEVLNSLVAELLVVICDGKYALTVHTRAVI